jgi:hypothetical protein
MVTEGRQSPALAGRAGEGNQEDNIAVCQGGLENAIESRQYRLCQGSLTSGHRHPKVGGNPALPWRAPHHYRRPAVSGFAKEAWPVATVIESRR